MSEWEEVDKRLLRKRATELARPVEESDEDEITTALLEFSMLGARYSVYLDRVEAVTRIADIVSIPLTPRHFAGVIRRRGKSIALVNLRQFFHSDARGVADADFAVIVSAKGKQFALQVDEIQGVSSIVGDSLLPAPDNFDAAQVPYIAGITQDGLAVIDLESLVKADGFSTENPKA